MDAVVGIYAELKPGVFSQGTGFFISADGDILTAYHVVQGAKSIEVFDVAHNIYDQVYVKSISADYDLAVVKVVRSGPRRPFLKLRQTPSSTNLSVYTYGWPRGVANFFVPGSRGSEGTVLSTVFREESSQERLFAKEIDVIPLSLVIESGMSGAPLISPEGDVLGVLSGSFRPGGSITWAIPVKYVASQTSFRSGIGEDPKRIKWPPLALMRPVWRSLQRRGTSNDVDEAERNAFVKTTHAHIAAIDSLNQSLPVMLRSDSVFDLVLATIQTELEKRAINNSLINRINAGLDTIKPQRDRQLVLTRNWVETRRALREASYPIDKKVRDALEHGSKKERRQLDSLKAKSRELSNAAADISERQLIVYDSIQFNILEAAAAFKQYKVIARPTPADVKATYQKFIARTREEIRYRREMLLNQLKQLPLSREALAINVELYEKSVFRDK